jgi:NTE family protein
MLHRSKRYSDSVHGGTLLFDKLVSSKLNLALQGGGAHGAFTWGVLDRLLEEERIAFDGISGSSAGAMNAVIMAQGLMQGGRQAARVALDQFWSAVARSTPFSTPFESMLPGLDHTLPGSGPSLKFLLHWTQYFSPSQLNPFDLNPLRDILQEQIDFPALRRHCPVKLFVAATNANSGKIKLFRAPEITADALLASACLPALHRAVEIGGQAYWDGGYAANPAIYPLFYECRSRDILLVLLAPLQHKETPHGADAIKSRIAELAFNSTFLREMRMFAHLREYLRPTWLRLGRFERRLMNTHFHMIEAQEFLGELGTETKLIASGRLFTMLKEQGQARAQAWLQTHRSHLGVRSTVDLAEVFA